MTVGCVTDYGRSIFDVVLRFTRQSTAERHVNRSASTDGDAGQMLRHYDSHFLMDFVFILQVNSYLSVCIELLQFLSLCCVAFSLQVD